MTSPQTNDNPVSILAVHASGRRNGSISRMLTADVIEALEMRAGDVRVTHRDLAEGVPLVDESWINANFTPADKRSKKQREQLAVSDELVDELQAADIVVIGAPIYNFGVPAALKAWIDMIARARKTFRYTDNGPKGLLEGKKAYVVIASGGVAVDSPIDFATPYLRHALGFIGIDNVEVIAAERLNQDADGVIDAARMHIAELIHTSPLLDERAA